MGRGLPRYVVRDLLHILAASEKSVLLVQGVNLGQQGAELSSLWLVGNARDELAIDNFKSSVRKINGEFIIRRRDHDLVGCDHGDRTAIRQVKGKWLKWAFISQVSNRRRFHVGRQRFV